MASRNEAIKQRVKVKRKLLFAISLGSIFLIIPMVLILTDPMFIIAKYKFRLGNGSILHELLQSEMEGGRFAVYLFNITNVDRFLTGQDHKLKLEEVGPFTYLEYRKHDNLELDSKAGVMRYTPKLRTVFVSEDSIAHPKDVYVTVPNIPMLSATTMIRSSPYFVRSLYNVVVQQFKSKPIVTLSADKYLWGYEDPLLTLANSIVPGLIHFNTTGIMDRLYDKNLEYRMELGATDEDKFSIKTIKKYRRTVLRHVDNLAESTTTFSNTYEGMAYPPKVTTRTPVNIYRIGICKSFEMELCGRKTSEYGSNAFVYRFSDRMFLNNHSCDRERPCLHGVMDMSSCFYGLPLGLSKGHFLDADPKIFERIEGLNPVKEKHSSHLVIEPKIGLTLETAWSLQANIIIGNISYNAAASKFSNMVLPIAHFKITQPQLPTIAVTALRMMYITAPFVLYIIDVISFIVGLTLLSYSGRLLFCSYRSTRWVVDAPADCKKSLVNADLPQIGK